jgi:hypothetical protein
MISRTARRLTMVVSRSQVSDLFATEIAKESSVESIT